MRVRSIVGLIPLFAAAVIDGALLRKRPGFGERLRYFREQRSDLATLISRWDDPGTDGRRLLALARMFRMTKLPERMLDESEFLSPHGVRALSRHYLDHPFEFEYGGLQYRMKYTPRESDSGVFGVNCNWHGPVWMPVNFLLVESLRHFHAYYGNDFKVECPVRSGRSLTLGEVVDFLRRLIGIFLRDQDGRRPVFDDCATYRTDPHFRDLIPFHEYFDGDMGRGLGAGHQTGWTGLVANLIDRLATGRERMW
jgi:hypothetical protein